jgi:hypothetical protein
MSLEHCLAFGSELPEMIEFLSMFSGVWQRCICASPFWLVNVFLLVWQSGNHQFKLGAQIWKGTTATVNKSNQITRLIP